jgi:hypothetical protein
MSAIFSGSMCHINISSLQDVQRICPAFKFIRHFLQEGNTTKDDKASHNTGDGAGNDDLLK